MYFENLKKKTYLVDIHKDTQILQLIAWIGIDANSVKILRKRQQNHVINICFLIDLQIMKIFVFSKQ